MPDAAEETTDVPFPAGMPKPHHTEQWARALKRKLIEKGILDISMERVPEGKFPYLYPSHMLVPPDKPKKDASTGELLAYRKYSDEIDKRNLHNKHVVAQRDEWFEDGNHTYFEILTDTMVTTAPGLRRSLRDNYVTDTGKFDGVGAAKFATEYLQRMMDSFPQEKFYDAAWRALMRKRLTA